MSVILLFSAEPVSTSIWWTRRTASSAKPPSLGWKTITSQPPPNTTDTQTLGREAMTTLLTSVNPKMSYVWLLFFICVMRFVNKSPCNTHLFFYEAHTQKVVCECSSQQHLNHTTHNCPPDCRVTRKRAVPWQEANQTCACVSLLCVFVVKL